MFPLSEIGRGDLRSAVSAGSETRAEQLLETRAGQLLETRVGQLLETRAEQLMATRAEQLSETRAVRLPCAVLRGRQDLPR